MQKLTLEENEPAERPKSPDELLRGIAKRNDKIRDLGWPIVQEAWLNGQDLIHLKEQLGHGKYLLALKSVGMKPDRAARYMRLARGHQISDCQKFETIATALKAISKPRKKKSEDGVIDPEIIVEEKLTKAEKRLLREDALIQQARDAEAEKAKVEEDLTKAQQKIKFFEEEKRVDEGFQRGASVLDHAQNEVSNLRAKIADKEMKEKGLMSENHYLRRELGRVRKQKEKLEKQLEAFKEGEV